VLLTKGADINFEMKVEKRKSKKQNLSELIITALNQIKEFSFQDKLIRLLVEYGWNLNTIRKDDKEVSNGKDDE